MTFTTIVTEVAERMGRRSADTITRIGRELNVRYRHVTGKLGIVESVRFVTPATSTTLGDRFLEFENVQKIHSVFDTADGGMRVLDEITVDQMRQIVPGTEKAAKYAVFSNTATSVTIWLDTTPQEEYDLYADALGLAGTLSGNAAPAWPEAFHDLLIEGVLADEYRIDKDLKSSAMAEAKFISRVKELQLHLRTSQYLKMVQNRTGSSRVGAGVTSSSGGGSGTTGGESWTQTGLISFHRSPNTPFVVQAGSAKVDNLDADLLDGQHGAYYLDRANHTGAFALTLADLPQIATDRLLGRDTAGTGVPEEISVGGGIEFTGAAALRLAAFTGDVTKAAGGTVLTIADDAVTYAKQQDVSAASRVIGRGSAAGAGNPEELTVAAPLNIAGTVLGFTVPGADTQVVFNDGGALAGDAGLTYNKTTDKLTAVGLAATTVEASGLISANGGQIAFPASQAASGGANTLDDYEEGTWTPADGSGAALSFTNVLGHYIKIGQLVIVWANLTYPNTADGSNAIISGFPFTTQTIAQTIYSCPIPHSGAGVFSGLMASAATTMSIVSTANFNARTNADVSGGATPTIKFTMAYRASA